MILGGNKISKVDENKIFNNLNGSRYFYKLINLKPKVKLNLDGNNHFCLYNLGKNKYNLGYKKLNKNISNDIVISKNCKVRIRSKNL